MKVSNEVAAPKFLNVQVIATPEKDLITGKAKYNTTFNPESLTATSHDTVINYQLIYPTPDGVKFKGMTVRPVHNDQLSDPSISKSGKLLTFSDANTVKEILSITLQFIDQDQIEFLVDPDLDNDPPPTL